MAKNGGNGNGNGNGGYSKVFHPIGASQIASHNAKAHIPHSPSGIPDQSEKRAAGMAAKHRQVMDKGPLTRTEPHESEWSSPLRGDVDITSGYPEYCDKS